MELLLSSCVGTAGASTELVLCCTGCVIAVLVLS